MRCLGFIGARKDVPRIVAAVAVAVSLAVGAPLLAGEETRPRCKGVLEECLKYLADKLKSSGWTGVDLDIDKKKGTYTVVKVLEHSPAEAAEIHPGDLLIAVNGMPIAEFSEKMLAGDADCWKPGRSVTYTIKRDDVDRNIRLVLAPMPTEVLARYLGEHIQKHAEHVDKDKE